MIHKESGRQVLLREEAAVDSLQNGQWRVQNAHVRVVTDYVLWIQGGQVAANDAAPISALDEELLVAQTQHQVTHHSGHFSGIKSGTRGSLKL